MALRLFPRSRWDGGVHIELNPISSNINLRKCSLKHANPPELGEAKTWDSHNLSHQEAEGQQPC